MHWIRIRELVRKEFIQLLRDRRTRSLLIVAPVIQLLVFGYVVSTEVQDIRVGFLDQAHTRESRRVFDAFNANRTFRITHSPKNDKEQESLLLNQDIDMAVQIPPDFSEQLRPGGSVDFQIIVDGSMSNMASIRIAYASVVIDSLNRSLLSEIYPYSITYGKVDERVRTWYNPNLDSQNFFIPGVVAFLIMLTTLLFTSMAIIREREAGTLEQLIVTPIRPYEFILGKTVPYILVAVIQMILVTVLAVFWFDIPLKGSIWLLFAGTCLFLLSTVGTGLFISTVSSTQQQAMMTTFFFMLPFFLLGGLVFPIVSMPEPIQWLTYAIPLRYFLVIVRGIFLKGVGLSVLWPQYLSLLVLGMVLLIGAVSRFRKRLD